MAKYLSNRQKNLKLGINSYTENQTVLEVTGKVGIGTTNATSELWVNGDGYFVGVVTASNFYVGGNVIGGGSISGTNIVGSALSISGISTIGNLQISSGIVTASSGIVTYYGDGSKLSDITAAARVVISRVAPSSPVAGDLWYHSTQARLFVYYTDISSSQWVDASPFNMEQNDSGASVSVGSSTPSGATSGDLWYNSNYGRLFVYYRDGDSDQWVDAAPFNYPTRDQPTKTENSFTATAGQTSFSVTYEVGYVEVYLNGIRLSSSEYIATSGASIILNEATAAGDIVDVIEMATGQGPSGPQGPQGADGAVGSSTRTLTTYTATAGQIAFFATYELGYIDVYRNGVRLTSNIDFTANDGEIIALTNETNAGDTLEIIAYHNISLANASIIADTSPQLGGNLDLNSKDITGTGNISITGGINLTGNISITGGINLTGIVTATDFNSTSDINLKTNIKAIEDPLDKLVQITGVSFNWKDTDQSSAGVIAQDVEKVMPEIIREFNDTKSVNYNGLIGLLIESVKEQNQTIKMLTEKINTLEERLS